MTSQERKEKVESLMKENRKNQTLLNTIVVEMGNIDEAIAILQSTCPDHDNNTDECITCKWERPF